MARVRSELERWPSEVVRLKDFFKRWRERESAPQQEWKTPQGGLGSGFFGKKG